MRRIFGYKSILKAVRTLFGVCALIYVAAGCSSGREYVYVPKGVERVYDYIGETAATRVSGVSVGESLASEPESGAAPGDYAVQADTLNVSMPKADTDSVVPMNPRGVRLGLHTNMLMDVAAIPNIGLEVVLGKGFTLDAEWYYAWWRNSSRHRFWRIYGGDLTARYYLKGAKSNCVTGVWNPYTGHHFGIYGGAFTFCFEWGGKGYLGGKSGKSLWDRCMVNAGVEYGYTLPVGRRINLDFSLGVGYIGGIIEEYTPRQGEYLRLSTKRHHWFGPTRAAVSLVWLIGPDNYNLRKGGGR